MPEEKENELTPEERASRHKDLTKGIEHASEALTFDAASVLDEKDRVQGLRVKGKQMPFGGAWAYNEALDELLLLESRVPEDKPAEERKD